jgi:hypothetical protein
MSKLYFSFEAGNKPNGGLGGGRGKWCVELTGFRLAVDEDGGAVWRNDVEVNAVMLCGSASGCGCGGIAEEAFAVELEFLAFEIEGGEFLDAGENIFQDLGSGHLDGEVESFLLEQMTDGVLDARGLIEFGVDFYVGNDSAFPTRVQAKSY